MENIKQEFNAIFLDQFGGDPRYGKSQLRDLESDEILIKVKTSTIHPADLAFTRGQYGQIIPDKLPLIPGGEGSGIIVKVGDNVSASLIGKHVCVFASSNKTGTFAGLWAEYHISKLENCIIFDKKIDFKTITFSMANPLTALGFLDTLKKHESKSVLQNGATSAFGKMFIKLCVQHGIKNISIVRKKENIQKLLDIGAYKVISTSEDNWEEELRVVIEETKPKVCFECVGGNMTGKILSLMPYNSIIYHFGNLELKRLAEIDTSDFIFQKKIFKGWWLNNWIVSLSSEEILYYKNLIKESLESKSDLFTTGYSKIFPLVKFEEAFMYYFTHMSEGKIVLEMNNDE